MAPSQLDLDQGGTFRQTRPIYLGPTVGYVQAPGQAIVNITTTGTTNVLPGNNLIKVNVNAAVTIQLPLAKGNHAGAGAVPGSFVIDAVTIADIGGFATNHTITILPAGSELIDGQANATITSAYGVVTLLPDVTNGGWNQSQ